MKSQIYSLEDYISHLKELKEAWGPGCSSFTFFIGAGFSVNFGLPNWSEYANMMLDMAIKYGYIPANYITKEELKSLDKKHILTLVHNLEKWDVDDFERNIFDVAAKSKMNNRKIVQEIIDSMSNVNASFVTTNYDNVLEHTFKMNKRNLSRNLANSEEEYFLRPQDVIHIHGDIYGDNKILSRPIAGWTEYFELYMIDDDTDVDPMKKEHKENLKRFLERLFSSNEVLFVGYSLTEMELLKFILKENTNYDGISKLTVLFGKHDHTDAEILSSIYKKYGLNTLFVNTDSDGYDAVLKALKEISDNIQIESLIKDIDEEIL